MGSHNSLKCKTEFQRIHHRSVFYTPKNQSPLTVAMHATPCNQPPLTVRKGRWAKKKTANLCQNKGKILLA
jgi:hypothetical protein